MTATPARADRLVGLGLLGSRKGYRRISPVQRSKPRGNVPTNPEYFFDLFKRFA